MICESSAALSELLTILGTGFAISGHRSLKTSFKEEEHVKFLSPCIHAEQNTGVAEGITLAMAEQWILGQEVGEDVAGSGT